jgi:hypothetical protein
MKKKYIAKSDVSINVLLPSGKNMHVSFAPKTNGGSVYYTDVEDVQVALEKHYRFGKLYKVDTTFTEEVKVEKPITPVVEGNGMKQVHISDPDSAKAYLSEKFGVSRTKMKSLKSIKDEALAHNIEFVGL